MDETRFPEEHPDVPAPEGSPRREAAGQGGEQAPSEGEQDRHVDVEQIMAEIQSALEERRRAGELAEPDMGHYHVFDSPPGDLDEKLKEVNARSGQIYEPFDVSSRTPVLGDLWAALRRRIHEEVRSYLDPMVWRQSEFNTLVSQILNIVAKGLYGGSLARSLQTLHREVQLLRQQVADLQDQVGEQQDRGERGDEAPADGPP